MIGKKRNQGAMVVEMCVIMPIVVAVLMLAIHMMLIQINKSVTMGEMYHMACNRESYFLNGGSFDTTVLANQLAENVRQQLQLAQDLKTVVTYNKSGTSLVSGYTGCITFSMQYTESYPGVAPLIDSTEEQKTVTIEKTVRDTSNNLRRWQLYGSIL